MNSVQKDYLSYFLVIFITLLGGVGLAREYWAPAHSFTIPIKTTGQKNSLLLIQNVKKDKISAYVDGIGPVWLQAKKTYSLNRAPINATRDVGTLRISEIQGKEIKGTLHLVENTKYNTLLVWESILYTFWLLLGPWIGTIEYLEKREEKKKQQKNPYGMTEDFKESLDILISIKNVEMKSKLTLLWEHYRKLTEEEKKRVEPELKSVFHFIQNMNNEKVQRVNEFAKTMRM